MLFFVFGVFSNSAKIMRTVVLLLLVAIAADEFASSSTSALLRCHALSSHVAPSNINDDGGVVLAAHERPLLRRFGRGINKRIRRSEDGRNRSGQDGAYTSHEIIPCLDMRSTMSVSPREREGGGRDDGGWDRALGEGSSSSSAMEGAGGHCYYPASSTRSEIRRAFVESSRGGGGAGRRRDDCNHHDDDEANDGASASASAHGRSSGSGCTIVRLCGSDASSMRDLMNYAHRFFDMVDDDGRRPPLWRGGEWGRPIIPLGHDGTAADRGDGTRRVPPPCAYVIVLAGEFLQLTSNGQVPVCIHRVVPPRNNAHDAGGTTDDDDCDGDERRDIRRRPMTYKPRVSAPMFLRPRRGMDATLDVGRDLRYVMGGDESTSSSSSSRGGIPLPSPSSGDARRPLYYERGLIDESDGMHLWSAHDIMKRK